MLKPILKAVFPVAGLGSRFLPATKAMPKEMLPIVDKPLIQYAVEEAIAAGFTEMIFVTGRSKRAIEDHFDKAYELENELAAKDKQALLRLVRKTAPSHVSFSYVRQAQPLGLGHAILCAAPIVGNDNFAVILADDLIDAAPGALSQMVKARELYGANMLAVEEVALADTCQYGIVSTSAIDARNALVTNIVEKPHPSQAPSTLAVVGRYILAPEIFQALRSVQPGAGGEIQLTDAISALCGKSKFIAHRFEGKRYDCGSKLGYLQANVAFALQHFEVRQDFNKFLAEHLV